MPAIPPALIADYVLQTPWAERKFRNYYEIGAGPYTVADLSIMAGAIHDHFKPAYKAITTNQVRHHRVEIRWIGPGGIDMETSNSTGADYGDVTALHPTGIGTETALSELADTLPDEAALIIQLRTSQAGRSKRGRRFLCGLSEAIQNAGIIGTYGAELCKSVAALFPQSIMSGPLPDFASSIEMHARHWDRKNNLLHPVTHAYALKTVGTRKDRRQPLALSRL